MLIDKWEWVLSEVETQESATKAYMSGVLRSLPTDWMGRVNVQTADHALVLTRGIEYGGSALWDDREQFAIPAGTRYVREISGYSNRHVFFLQGKLHSISY